MYDLTIEGEVFLHRMEDAYRFYGHCLMKILHYNEETRQLYINVAIFLLLK